MSVQRYDLNRCIGCRNCVNVCPMDVFRFNEELNKSVIAYPENCQTCGQCFVNCLGHSLALSGEGYGYPVTSLRSASVLPMNRQLYVSDTPKNRVVMPAIVGVFGAMFAHNAIIWGSKAAEQRAAQNPTITRMSTNQRWQHLVMLLSFICLVFTGFGMRYFGVELEHAAGVGVHLLSVVHRIAGVLLIASGVYHLFYVIFVRDGQRLLRGMITSPKGASNVFSTLCYYLGLNKEKPKLGRFTCAEKAGYWFLVLGTVSMGITGAMMWAYLRAGHLFLPWWVSFARSWHVYEAILVSLAVVIWHFHQVFAHPGVAPMNFAWDDGKMPVEHYRYEHELDTVLAQEGQSE